MSASSYTYGAFVGKLLIPSFIISAASPIIFAFIIENYGANAALYTAIAIGLLMVAASLSLKVNKSVSKKNAGAVCRLW